jgi:hypothetical protein
MRSKIENHLLRFKSTYKAFRDVSDPSEEGMDPLRVREAVNELDTPVVLPCPRFLLAN